MFIERADKKCKKKIINGSQKTLFTHIIICTIHFGRFLRWKKNELSESNQVRWLVVMRCLNHYFQRKIKTKRKQPIVQKHHQKCTQNDSFYTASCLNMFLHPKTMHVYRVNRSSWEPHTVIVELSLLISTRHLSQFIALLIFERQRFFFSLAQSVFYHNTSSDISDSVWMDEHTSQTESKKIPEKSRKRNSLIQKRRC